jgi:hypothetical protein
MAQKLLSCQTADLPSLILQQTSPLYVGLCLSGDEMQDSSLFSVPPATRNQLREQLKHRLINLGADRVLGSQLVPLINQALAPKTYSDLFPVKTRRPSKKCCQSRHYKIILLAVFCHSALTNKVRSSERSDASI